MLIGKTHKSWLHSCFDSYEFHHQSSPFSFIIAKSFIKDSWRQIKVRHEILHLFNHRFFCSTLKIKLKNLTNWKKKLNRIWFITWRWDIINCCRSQNIFGKTRNYSWAIFKTYFYLIDGNNLAGIKLCWSAVKNNLQDLIESRGCLKLFERDLGEEFRT